MSLIDRIRARRERRRIEKGREVFQQNALFDNVMSSLYGSDWRGNERINNDDMRRQFAANKDLFMQQARQRPKDNNKPSTDPDIQIPSTDPGIQLPGTVQAQKMTLDDMATQLAAPSPVMGNINAGVQRFSQQATKAKNNRNRWLNEANNRLAKLSKELGYNFGKVDSVDDVAAIQKYLGVSADGKFGNNTYQAMRNAYNNGAFGHVGKPYTHEIEDGGGKYMKHQ